MSDSGIGFGGFLLGVGGGYYLFQYVDFSFDIISYLLILMGVGIILGSILTKGGKSPLSDVFGGVVGGLFFAVFLTQGFGLLGDFSNQWDDIDSPIYRATETISLDAPLDADALILTVEAVNGGIDVSSWSGDSVELELEIRAKGDTDAEAERNIDDFEYTLQDTTVDDTLELSLTFPISNTNWNLYTVLITVKVPEGVDTELLLDSTNGKIVVSDLVLSGIDVETTNGVITLNDIKSQTINVDTTNGGIFGTITSSETHFSTTNGIITIELMASSGEHEFDTTNGIIELTLPTGSDIGYSIDLDTSVGAIDVNLPNIDYSVDRIRNKIGETEGFSSKDIQITINADTTIGAIEIN
jgi:DUF4097 and DUF4098 domain-containing protein YvlB